MKVAQKILIIEDERPLQEALSETLTHEGFECICTDDGEEGLQSVLEQKPDLIMLDLVMPKVDGFEILKKLRADPWGSTARVIILTNLAAENSDRIRAAVDTYPEFYLVKSNWSIGNVVKKTKEILSKPK